LSEHDLFRKPAATFRDHARAARVRAPYGYFNARMV